MISGRRLLVIDDEEEIRITLEEYFEFKEYEVSSVDDGHKAIKLLRSENGKFDLIITDLKMKNVSGIAVAKWTREHFPHIPVIMITAYPHQYESLAEEAKADLLLQKPLDFSKLEMRVQALLSKTGSNRGLGRGLAA